MKKINFFIVLLCLLGITSCSKDENTNDQNTLSTVEISGRVIDESGNPLSGVQIHSGENVVSSNSSGTFTIQGTAINNRGFISAKTSGYFDSFKGFKSDNSTYLEVMMISKGTPVNFNSATGATLSNNGGTVKINGNSLKSENGSEYLGEVTAYIRFFSPIDENFGLLMQGGDFRGISSTNEVGTLVSYGYFSVELEDTDGNKLNLKENTTASVTYQIAPEQQGQAPATIPLWYFDEKKGVWKEEGSASKNGTQYTGTVSHFSSWNVDLLFPRGTITGKLVCKLTGTPLSHSLVIIKQGTTRLFSYTNLQGEFQIDIPANVMYELYLGTTDPDHIYWYGISVTPGYKNDIGTHNYYCN